MKWTDVEIWRYLLDRHGESVYVEDLCFNFGMTRRQMLARMSAFEHIMPIKKVEGKDVSYAITAAPQERIDATAKVLASFYGCSPSRILGVTQAISIAGYMSLEEISKITDLPTRDLAYMLRVMPNVMMTKDYNKKNHYIRRNDCVPDNLGIADACAQFS